MPFQDFNLASRDEAASIATLNQVVKAIKREESSFYNCVNSIFTDSSFVQEIAGYFQPLPVCANLRCGLWYTRTPSLVCYFKSTDGHYGNWNFSTTRINWHVALEAGRSGGCVLVDATRRGKVFPDAMSKTIPIWAAVINRAISQHRKQILKGNTAHSLDWDKELHLPPWISENERASIEKCLDRWVQDLLQCGVDLEELENIVTKPLRAVWISQQSRIWLNYSPQLNQLEFTPLVLVTASNPNARQRNFTGLANSEGLTRTYLYLPGAGDDEESWAKGLTPELFWQNYEVLINSNPEKAEELAKQLVSRSKSQRPPAADADLQATISGRPEHCQAVMRDVHHPSVQGCEPAALANMPPSDSPTFIGDTGIALGSAAAASSEVWSKVDAVLNVGLVNLFRAEGLEDRFYWLPIKTSKYDRHSLESSLPLALDFISRQLRLDRSVLIYCQDGKDLSVCVVLALLSCCYSVPNADSQCSVQKFYHSRSPEIISSLALGSERCSLQHSNNLALGWRSDKVDTSEEQQSSGESENSKTIHVKKSKLTKVSVRQRLTYISKFYPFACPSRGNLRQVHSFLLRDGLSCEPIE